MTISAKVDIKMRRGEKEGEEKEQVEEKRTKKQNIKPRKWKHFSYEAFASGTPLGSDPA